MQSGPLERWEKEDSLQPQETILGLFGEYVGPGDAVWSGGLVRLLEDLRFSAAASRIALNRVVARGLLLPSRDGRFVHYTISPRLAAVHEAGRQRMLSMQPEETWSGVWTLVSYSIPEELRAERGRFGRWLNFTGFGSLQDGVWVAPDDRCDDVRALARRLRLEDHVSVLAGPHAGPASVRRFAARIWNLDWLRDTYAGLAGDFAFYAADAESLAGLDPRMAFVLRTRVIEMFRRTVANDPKLPDAVLQTAWPRKDVIAAFHLLHRTLAAPAQRHFSAVTARRTGA
ncbi:MAG: PaaX family transcriptional regulator C-terminal domain-containing protein [Alphaproteobacteria bacterium]